MEKFVFLDHKADILFEAEGFTFEEALQNAALAMFTTIADVAELHCGEHVKIEERAESLDELAVFTLSSILSKGDAMELFFKDFKINSFKKEKAGYTIEGVACGETSSSEKSKNSVKAVTMHEAKVWKDRNIWKIRILLDI